MEKLFFTNNIQASKEKVWDVLWGDSSYRQWTSVFCEGSHAITDWKEGSKVLFVDENGSGMVSMVAGNRPYEYMGFKHLGEVKNNVEDTTSEKIKEWAGGMEEYQLTENDGTTQLTVTMDSVESFKDYFMNTWPKAMEAIKNLAEGKLLNITNTNTITEPIISTGSQKIVPFLWFDGKAEEAMNFYVSIFKNACVVGTSPGPDGKVMSAMFKLEGQDFYALNGGPMFSFSPAISLFVKCNTQEEVDYLWDKLSEGGQQQRCGWLQDQFGVSWQIIPNILGELLQHKNPEIAKKAMMAMLQMTKINIQELKDATAQI